MLDSCGACADLIGITWNLAKGNCWGSEGRAQGSDASVHNTTWNQIGNQADQPNRKRTSSFGSSQSELSRLFLMGWLKLAPPLLDLVVIKLGAHLLLVFVQRPA